jgi:hypothetical protein
MKPGNLIPLIVDNFAGGGGASTGIEQALGRAVDIAFCRASAEPRRSRRTEAGSFWMARWRRKRVSSGVNFTMEQSMTGESNERQAALATLPTSSPEARDALTTAAIELLAALDEALPKISDAIVIATIHHAPYDGPRLDIPADKLRAALTTLGGAKSYEQGVEDARAILKALSGEQCPPAWNDALDMAEAATRALTHTRDTGGEG